MQPRALVALSLSIAIGACSGDDTSSNAGSGGQPGPAAASGGNSASGSGTGGGGLVTGASGSAANGGKGGAGKGGGSAAMGGKGGGAAANAGKGGTGNGSGGNASGTGGTTNPDSGASVLERNLHPSRDGNFLQPMLTQAAVAKMAKDANFAATFTGDMWSVPLYLEQGPSNKGVFFAALTNNNVVALDETTGSMVWMKNIGAAPQQSGAGCGSIHPVGILSTPVIDATARTIYVAGGIGSSNIERHEVHALNVDDGTERDNWPVDVSKVKNLSTTFMPQPQNQRSALSLVNGVVYVAYGGHVGDCGNYHGWVFGINGSDPSKAGGWATLGQGEAIWAAGGMASDGNGVFAVTSNSTNGASMRAQSDSEQVVRITGLGSFDRNDKNLYFPTSWRTMDSQDADFGASSPVFVQVPGATPDKFVVAIAKDGHMYILDSTNLGGMGPPLVDFPVASGSMTVRTVPASYTTSSGVHVVFSANAGAKCPSGGPSGSVVMSVKIAAGSPPVPTVAWCASVSGEYAPIVTTTDGQADPVVWFINNGKLTAVNGETGAALWTSSDSCSGVQRWTSPIAVKGRIVVGGNNHLCSWSVH